MSFILDGLGGKQILLGGLGESGQTTAGSIQARQQSSGVGYIGDQVVIPQGGFGTFSGSVGGGVPKKKPVTGIGASIQARQESAGRGRIILLVEGFCVQAAQETAGVGKLIILGQGAVDQSRQESTGRGRVLVLGNGSGVQSAQVSIGKGKLSISGAGACHQAPQRTEGTGVAELFTDQELSAFMAMVMKESEALV